MDHSKISNAGEPCTWENLMSAINPPMLTAEVKNGVVLLKGKVDHYAGKVAAVQAVSTIAGVREVICEIRIAEPEKQLEDREIEKQVLHVLTGFQPPQKENRHSRRAEIEYWELFEQHGNKDI